MTGMDDLTTWFRACLDADERLAREAAAEQSPPWKAVGGTYGWAVLTGGGGIIGGVRATSEHIALWDPKRALDEVDAKRRILDAYEADDNSDLYDGCGDDCEWKALGWAVRLLALPFADREGYDESWRP